MQDMQQHQQQRHGHQGQQGGQRNAGDHFVLGDPVALSEEQGIGAHRQGRADQHHTHGRTAQLQQPGAGEKHQGCTSDLTSVMRIAGRQWAPILVKARVMPTSSSAMGPMAEPSILSEVSSTSGRASLSETTADPPESAVAQGG